jgi:Rap1 Myb domain
VDPEDFRIQRPGKTARTGGPLKTFRRDYTAEEDKVLLDYLRRVSATSAEGLSGTNIYKELEKLVSWELSARLM